MPKCMRCNQEFKASELADYKGWPHCRYCYETVTAPAAPRDIPANMDLPPSYVPPAPAAAPAVSTVRVVGLDLPFWDMVVLMVKWGIAAVPAMLVLMVLFALLWAPIIGLVSRR